MTTHACSLDDEPTARESRERFVGEDPSASGRDRTRSSLPPGVHVGQVLSGTYRLDRVRGAGGMGVVVEAWHLRLERRIAIKFMSSALGDDERGVQRFMLEAQAAARIQSEHVVRVFDVALLADGTPYIVMEYLEGEDLGELLESRGSIPVEEAIDYVLQACEAVAEAHVAGIVHRDLKPGNLFCCRRPDGSPLVKVLDFGVSKLLPRADRVLPDVHATGADVIIGSPPYSSPEQLRGPNSVDGRTDIWALGVILYELVAGRSPFAADTFMDVCSRVIHATVEPLSQVRLEVPRKLDAVISRALAKEREDRFATLAGLAEALAPFASPASWLSIGRIESVLGRGAGGSRSAGPDRTGRTDLRILRRARAAMYCAAALGMAAVVAIWASLTAGATVVPAEAVLPLEAVSAPSASPVHLGGSSGLP